MRNEIVHFNDESMDIFMYQNWRYFLPDKECRDSETKKLIAKSIIRCIETQLTEKQRRCFTMYVFDGIPQKEIAKELGLNSSTVSRHVKAAKTKLFNLATVAGLIR